MERKLKNLTAQHTALRAALTAQINDETKLNVRIFPYLLTYFVFVQFVSSGHDTDFFCTNVSCQMNVPENFNAS